MIKFFRKIRQNLLMENKTGKYLKYALGEIVLVVIGIMIALQINNWNENRKFTYAQNIFLNGIKADLQNDKEFIEEVLSNINPKIEVFELLNKEGEVYFINRVITDSLLSIYLFSGQRTFYPVSGTYLSAVAGNKINAFEQKEVIQNIIKLYSSTYARLVDNGEILDERWSGLSKIYSHERRTNQFSNLNTDKLSLVLDDIYFHYLQMIWYKNILNNTIAEIEQVLREIDD